LKWASNRENPEGKIKTWKGADHLIDALWYAIRDTYEIIPLI
jgi:hypothetical protein